MKKIFTILLGLLSMFTYTSELETLSEFKSEYREIEKELEDIYLLSRTSKRCKKGELLLEKMTYLVSGKAELKGNESIRGADRMAKQIELLKAYNKIESYELLSSKVFAYSECVTTEKEFNKSKRGSFSHEVFLLITKDKDGIYKLRKTLAKQN